MANDVSGSTPEAESAGAAGTQYAPEALTGRGKTQDKSGADVNLDLVLDVPVSVSLRVGTTDMSIRDLVKLVEGSVVALDRQADQAMDVLVNGTLIAHGEIVVVDDRFGVRLTDVVSPVERIQKIN
jgi:flagellar motor switch protein FliN/FliY